MRGIGREVRAAVVQHHAGALGHHARAEVHVEALDQRDRHAVLVDRAQVDRVAAVERHRLGPGPLGVDARAQRPQPLRLQLLLDAAAGEIGIAEGRVAQRDGALHGLDREVVPERFAGAAVAGQHAHRQQRARALRVGRVGQQLAALPRQPQRQRRHGALRGQVVDRHAVAAPAERGGDARADRAGIEGVGTAAADRGQRVGQLRIAQHVARARQAAAEEQPHRLRIGAQHRLVGGEVGRHHVGDRETVARVALGRRQQLVQAQPAVQPADVFPRAHRAGDGHAERAALRQDPAGQRVERGGARRAAAAVVRDGAARARVVDDPERVAADAAAGGVDHRQHGVGGDRRVDGVAAAAQHLGAGRAGLGVRGRDHRAGRARDGAAGSAHDRRISVT